MAQSNMQLISIEKKRNKIILKFNNAEDITIYYDVYLSFPLYKGDNISSEKIKKLQAANNEYEVKRSAFRYLSGRNHSYLELKNKLKKKGFNIAIIEKVLDELKEKKYLNDFSFAENFVRNRIERKKEGIMKITSELFKKGIDREIIAEVTKGINNNPKNFNNALMLAKNKYEKLSKRNETELRKIKGKLFNFLKSRGYTSDIIFKVFEKIIDNDEF